MQKIRATSFVVKNNSILMIHRFSKGEEVFDYTDSVSRNRLFLIEVKEGELKISDNSPEFKKQSMDNKYSPEWVSVNEILFLTIWPLQTREFLFKYFKLI